MMIEYTLLATLAFHHLVVGSVLFLFLAFINYFVHSSPELRSWLWMTVFVASTLVPFTLITNGVQDKSAMVQWTDGAVQTQNKQSPTLEQSSSVQIANSWHLPSEIIFDFSFLLTIGIIVWVIGSVWRAKNVLLSYVKTQNLIQSTKQRFLLLSNRIDAKIFTSTKVSSPLVIGFRQPKIILPQSITDSLTLEQLYGITLHEYAHIQRKDNWFGLFQELIAILFWWSPVIRLLNKKIHVEREIACDLRAVETLKNDKQYAQSLVDCAKLMVMEKRNILAMGLFSKKKELNYRVGAVLKSKTFKRPTIKAVMAMCAAMSITTIQATQLFSPKISVRDTVMDARQYSLLSMNESELLIKAVAQNDIEAIKLMQNEGVDINVPAIGDGTALMIAVKRNNRTMVENLIQLGADVNQSSIGDGNPLIVAAMTDNIELANLLLNYGANVNGIVKHDETPLINASYRGFYDMAELLIARGADVNLAVTTGYSDGYQRRSPLNRARTEKMRDLLIRNGATE